MPQQAESNDHAQPNDTIEITHASRIDFGKRMQVVSSGETTLVALDNRVRVTVRHGEYKVVKRVGRIAIAAAGKQGGKTLATEKRLAAEATAKQPDTVILNAADMARDPYIPVVTAKRTQAVATDADVAGIGAAPAVDVPVARKADREKAQRGDLIELTEARGAYTRGEWLEVLESASGYVRARGARDADELIHVSDCDYSITKRKADMQPGDLTWLRRRVCDETANHAPTQHSINNAKFSVNTLTQDELDAMTRQSDVKRKHAHYFKPTPYEAVDVYRVLSLFAVTDPCLQHAIKKLLVAGGRGHKDAAKDVQEAIDALERWQEMRKEESAA